MVVFYVLTLGIYCWQTKWVNLKAQSAFHYVFVCTNVYQWVLMLIKIFSEVLHCFYFGS